MKTHALSRTARIVCGLALGAILAFSPQAASAKNLGVTHFTQKQTDPNGNAIGNNWCWGATSKMVLDYYGYPQSIFDIITYGLGNSTYDTWNYMWGTGTESRTNVEVWEEIKLLGVGTGVYKLKKKTITITWNGIAEIVGNFSNKEVQTQTYTRSLAANEVTKEIDENDAPFFIRLGWFNSTTGVAGGGHFIVCYGVNTGTLSIHDPWFGSYLGSQAAMEDGTGISEGNDHKWTHTVTTSKVLDVLFLFDTTGSMGSSISSAKANASSLLDKINAKFKNYRVAVADYKDYPQSPYGDPGDYVYNPRLAFTKDKAAAQAAINGLSVSGGNDWPEAVYSALFNGLSGTGLSDGTIAWRANPAKRLIILIADAPAHDPEPFAGGKSFGEVITLATNATKPISVHALWVGFDINAGTNFNLIAGGTGGSVINTSGGDVGANLQAIVDSVAESPRFPKGETSAIYPTFVFEPLGNGGMGAPSTRTLIEIQKQNPVTLNYSRFRLITLKDPTQTLWTSTLPFPQAHYRWRLGFKRPAVKLFLPATGGRVATPAKTVFETEFTEFDRTPSIPGRVTIIAPNSGEYTEAAVEYSFGSVPGATKYVIEIYAAGRKWKTLTARPPASDPGAAVLKVLVRGHRADVFYNWRVQALNYDRPKADASAWTSSF